jgi:hypothetical protein
METMLSFLVQNCLLRYIIIFALHWLASVSSQEYGVWLTSCCYYLPQCLSIEWQERGPTVSSILAIMC